LKDRRVITAQQLLLARRSVNLTQLALAKASGVSMASISSLENNNDYRSSTARALQEALEAKGAIFLKDGSVAVRMIWEEPKPTDPRVKAAALAILNAARKSRGEAPYVDLEDGP
jgi:transcriptional regulator with XRE-family HTH domain